METITTIHALETLVLTKGKYRHDRTFGWFPKRDMAISFLKKNPEWIHECLYDYVVIETFPYGVHPIAINERWYKWNKKRNIFELIKKPKEIKNTISWGLG